jgi:restriction system protein
MTPMSVPKYHELIRPLLDLVADGRPRNLREASQELAEQLRLRDEDLAETLPSGYPRYLNGQDR